MSTPSPLTRDGFIQAQDAIAQAAEEKAAQRQHAKKKLTARERLSLFFDDGVWHEVGKFNCGSVRAADMDREEFDRILSSALYVPAMISSQRRSAICS